MRALALAPIPGNPQTAVSVLLSLCAAVIILGASAGIMFSVRGFDDAGSASPNTFSIVLPMDD